MTLEPDSDNAPAGGEPTAGAASGQTQSGFSRDPRQREAYRGSYSADDDDRPLWQRDTELVREHVYRNADGTPAFSVFRGRRSDGRKAFLIGQPMLDGYSALQLALADDPRAFYKFPGLEHVRKGGGNNPDLLYRYDELLRNMAARPHDPVFICEGEKDTDTLCALGLIATTNPHGALKWKSEYNETFARRDVVILIDNDPNGQRRGERLSRELRQ